MITRSNVLFFSVCDFLLFLGKLVVVLICGSASYFAFCGYIPHIEVSMIFSSSLQFIDYISDSDPKSELSFHPSILHHSGQLYDCKVELFLYNQFVLISIFQLLLLCLLHGRGHLVHLLPGGPGEE